MIYCINPEEIKKSKIPVDVFLYTLSVYLKEPVTIDTFRNTCAKNLINYDKLDINKEPVNPRLTYDGAEAVNKIIIDSEFKAKPDNNKKYDDIAEAIRELFPKGMKKVGNKEYPWRESKAVIAHRLKVMVKKFTKDFTLEEAVDATKRYVDSFKDDTTFMKTLPYFLWKMDNSTGMFTSDFLKYLENEDAEVKPSYESGELI